MSLRFLASRLIYVVAALFLIVCLPFGYIGELLTQLADHVEPL